MGKVSRRKKLRGDAGSIPMTLAILIVIIGIIAALAATALTAAVKAKATAASRSAALVANSVVDDYLGSISTNVTGLLQNNNGVQTLAAIQRTNMPNGASAPANTQLVWAMVPDPTNAQRGTLTVNVQVGIAKQQTVSRVQLMPDAGWTSSDEGDIPRIFVKGAVAFGYAMFGQTINFTPGVQWNNTNSVVGDVGVTAANGWKNNNVKPSGTVFNYSGTDVAAPTSIFNSDLRMAMDTYRPPSCSPGGVQNEGTLNDTWSSANNGIQLSPPAGKSYRCANKVVIDEGTQLTGGVTTFYTNEVVISANVSNADGKSAVNFISPSGSMKVTFSGATTAVDGVYIYNPRGNCQTAQNASINLTGSLACKGIQISGRVSWKAPPSPVTGSAIPLVVHEVLSDTSSFITGGTA